MILLDTGYLAALLDNRDELHDRALAWTRKVSESVCVTEYVLVETANLLSASVERDRLHALLQHVSHTSLVVWGDRPLYDAGLKLHSERPDKQWLLTDCISFVVMSARGISRALAYDHHFEQAGFEALLRRDP
jgi:uncharacterized protein